MVALGLEADVHFTIRNGEALPFKEATRSHRMLFLAVGEGEGECQGEVLQGVEWEIQERLQEDIIPTDAEGLYVIFVLPL